MKQGRGDATPYKEQGFARLLREDLAVFRHGRHGRTTYAHFDLTAGDGMNGEVLGSPLVFLNVVGASGVGAWRAWFVEKDFPAAQRLGARNELSDPRCRVECADNRNFIPRIPGLLEAIGEPSTYAIGSVIADPNGHKDMPLAEMQWLASKCPRLDLILNWNSAAVKRWFGYGQKAAANPHVSRLVRLNDSIARLGKRFWLIREPRDFWQWTILFGTNYERRQYERLGFYDIRTQHGISLLDRLSHSDKERNGRVQGSLF